MFGKKKKKNIVTKFPKLFNNFHIKKRNELNIFFFFFNQNQILGHDILPVAEETPDYEMKRAIISEHYELRQINKCMK